MKTLGHDIKIQWETENTHWLPLICLIFTNSDYTKVTVDEPNWLCPLGGGVLIITLISTTKIVAKEISHCLFSPKDRGTEAKVGKMCSHSMTTQSHNLQGGSPLPVSPLFPQLFSIWSEKLWLLSVSELWRFKEQAIMCNLRMSH